MDFFSNVNFGKEAFGLKQLLQNISKKILSK